MKKRKYAIALSLFMIFLMSGIPALAIYDQNMSEGPTFSLSDGENWLTGWLYRKQFTFGIDADVGAVPLPIDVNVEYGSGADAANVVYCSYRSQNDFDDIRFTTADGSTLVDYWIEEYTVSDDATFWVNYTLPPATPIHGYIYYGNGGVSTTSNGTNTFTVFEDWAAENADNWDTTTNTHGTPDAATWDDTDANSGSVLKLQGGAANAGAGWVWNGTAGSGGYYVSPDESFMGRVYAEETVTSFQRIYITSGVTGLGPWAGFQTREGVESANFVDDDDNTDTQPMDNAWCDTWTTFQVTRDGTNGRLYWRSGIIDTIEETGSLEPDTEDTVFGPYLYCRDTEYDLYVDWIVVRTWAGIVEPYFYNWQSEEGADSAWHIVGVAIYIFNVELDLIGFNMALVLLGLIMIPASTMYLVYGVKNDRSSDRLFYGLIMFFLGCGLFIGGILP